MRILFSFAALLTLGVSPVIAAVQTKTVEYQDGDVALQGLLAWDDAVKGKRPGVLVVHEWWGLNDYAKTRAKQLAAEGYVAFALDMYGKGKLAEHPQEAGKMAGAVRENIDHWRKRAKAGLKILNSTPQVDPSKLAAIGYCFGGSTVLQLALAGEPLQGVVSFHGALPTPTADACGKIKCKVLVCHGAADGFISSETIEKFRSAMDEGKADWQMVSYGGARHSFTNPGADKRGIDGLKYDANAERRSWAHMQMFFGELFK